MSSGGSAIVKKEMGYTHAEFLRLLPHALRSEEYSLTGTSISHVLPGGGSLVIDLGPEGERKIALMRMPCTPVTLSFDGIEDGEKDRFLKQFDRAYQRGGG